MLYGCFGGHESEVALFKEFGNCFVCMLPPPVNMVWDMYHPLSSSVLTRSWYLSFWHCIVGVGSWSWQKVKLVKSMLEFWVA